MDDLDIIQKLKESGIKLIDANLEYPYDDVNSYIFNEDEEVTNLEIRNIAISNKLLELIFMLEGLRYLTLNNCNIKKIPLSISSLIYLSELDLSYNQIEKIPNNIWCELDELIGLNLSHNNIKEIPDDIYDIFNLNELNLSNNKIEKIPNSLYECNRLEYINLSFNKIKNLPNNWSNDLIELDLSYNQIEFLSSNIKYFQSLEVLLLQDNKINWLPKEIIDLDAKIDLENNPITQNLLNETINLGSRELINYLLSIQKDGKPLNEAKILVLGDERVGKTSIINRIVGNDFEMNQKTTEGIDIQVSSLSNDIRINIWDFAGQEITHQTHQFFLSIRSFYLLVLDAQKEDNDSAIYDWLEVIKSNAGKSPIIIVINKHDLNKGYSFDIHRYKKDFPNILDVIYTSAQDDINIDKLKNSIEMHIEELENTRAMFNKNWFKVKENLEILSDNTDYIEGGEFDKICEQNKISNELDQQTLLNILHEIGTIVRYENRNLHSVQILNPLWVTNAVYKVIRSEFLNNNAILKREYLSIILKGDKRYKKRHYQWIMDLLVQFEIAFRVNEDELLIPSRLFNNQPDFNMNKFQSGLNLRYSYEGRLKKSVIAQFMVKMSRYLTNNKVPYWKNGVFLERSNSKAVVISNIDKREIYIYIDTQNNQGREFLAIIRDKFDEININSIVIEEIPLIMDSKIVGYEEYEYLVGLEQDGETTVTLKTDTKKRRERFEISRLLDGYTKNDKKTFDYDKLREDLIEISLSETKSRNSIYKESEDETNDRFERALFNRNYNVTDQSRGGESSSGINAGERDLVIRNSKGLDESVIEAFILKSLDSLVINKHYEKLVKRYDTVGNQVNFVLVYSKTKNFDELWKKYIKFDGFEKFIDTKDEFHKKNNLKVGISEYKKMRIYHLFINFYSES